MTRKGNTVLAAALKTYGKKIRKYMQGCIAKPLTVKVLIEDARDSSQKTSGVISIEIEIGKPGGWGNYNIIEIHGTVGLERTGKSGKKEDEAYLDGVTVGDWGEGSESIGLNGCSIGEFLVHMFTLFAIKAGNKSVLLDNAAGPIGEHIYKQVGFIKSKGDRAQYGDNNEMIFPLTGKKKTKDAGQLWRERYNKFRKKLKTKIKNANCKTFWKCVPPALEEPGPVHTIARGSKKKTRKKRGGKSRTRIKRGGFTRGERVKLTHIVRASWYTFPKDMVGTVFQVVDDQNDHLLVRFDEPTNWDPDVGLNRLILALTDNDIELVPPDNASDSEEEGKSESVRGSSSSTNQNIKTHGQGGGKRKKKTHRKRRTRKRQRKRN